MTSETTGDVLRHVCWAALGSGDLDLTDGQLLQRFLDERDELAFELLLRRHGPMILGVCRRMLGNAADADDAFQAVFLVLLRRGAALRARRTVGDFLHGVAYHTALKARAARVKRRIRERQAQPIRPAAAEEVADVVPLLDQEIAHLPAKYREAVVLCELQGRGRKEAAQLLQIPEGTLSSRLATTRKILARRLSRYGAPLLLAPATASVPSALAASTRNMAIGGASASVAALAEGVMKVMLLTKIKLLTVLLAVGVITGTVTAWHLAPAEQPAAVVPEKPEAERNRVPADDAAYRGALMAAWQHLAFQGESAHVQAILARHPELKEALAKRQKRMLRWVMTFNTRNGEDYRKQLHSLGIVLAVPSGPDGKTYKVLRDLSGRQPPQLREEDLSEIPCIFWIGDRPESIHSLLKALHLMHDIRPAHIVAFLPPMLEKRLFELEKEKAGVPEEKIVETKIEVVSDSRGGYEPRVISVWPQP